MPGQIDAFRQAAEAYCAWAEGPPSSELEEAQAALHHLVALLHYVMELPAGQLEPLPKHDILMKGPATEAIYRRFSALPFQYYSDVFHPTRTPPEPADMGDLSDDLMDIYADLKQGLLYAGSGHLQHAVYYWQFTFGVHWGRHATSALRAIHCHLTDPELAR